MGRAGEESAISLKHRCFHHDSSRRELASAIMNYDPRVQVWQVTGGVSDCGGNEGLDSPAGVGRSLVGRLMHDVSSRDPTYMAGVTGMVARGDLEYEMVEDETNTHTVWNVNDDPFQLVVGGTLAEWQL